MAARYTEPHANLMTYIDSGTKANKVREFLKNASTETRYDLLRNTKGSPEIITGVHRAVELDDMETLKYMLMNFTTDQHYQIVQIRNGVGATAIHWASRHDRTNLLLLLLDKLSSEQRFQILQMQNKEGDTALHYATNEGNLNVLSILLVAVTPDKRDYLLAIKNQRNKDLERFNKQSELSYGQAEWNSFGLEKANEKIRQLEEALRQLTTDKANQTAELQRLKNENTAILQKLESMDDFNRRNFNLEDTGDEEHES